MAFIIPTIINDASGNGAGDVARANANAQVDSARAQANADSAARIQEAQYMAEARQTEAADRRDAMIHDSDNRLQEEKSRDQTMRYAIMKDSQDFQFQVTAWLTTQLEGLDTKLQIAMKDAEVRIEQIRSDTSLEEKRIKNDARELDLREMEIKNAGNVSSDSLLA